MNTKPSHGPIHFRAPSKIFWRTVRGFVYQSLLSLQLDEVSRNWWFLLCMD